MTDALQKVDTPLMERYHTICENCAYERQFFGTATEARQSALTMGWEFRCPGPIHMKDEIEVAFCPHCKLLVPDA